MYEDKNPYDVFSVKGKTVIVTGGMGFLGRQYVEGFTVAGANVVIFDLKDRAEVDQDLHNICRLSESYIQYHKVDITNKDEVVNAVKQAHQTFKSIDILINNAALNPSFSSPDAEKLFADYETYDIELFRKELDIDVTAMLICAQAVMPYMKQQNSGVIINIASGVANKAYDNRTYDGTQKQGRKKSIAYTTAKTAVVGFTKQLAEYMARWNVRVNAFSPGAVLKEASLKKDPVFIEKYSRTTMLGRMAQPYEYVGVLLFLASDASSYMTGQNLTVDGGKSSF